MYKGLKITNVFYGDTGQESEQNSLILPRVLLKRLRGYFRVISRYLYRVDDTGTSSQSLGRRFVEYIRL